MSLTDRLSECLGAAYRRNKYLYEQVLRVSAGSPRFWDVVVLTACDDVQKERYERELSDRYYSGSIPSRTRYIVVADPPGPKVGSGGSTLIVLDHLAEMFDSDLATMRVLLIHAGGYCKRLPHASRIGKIFATLPSSDDHGMSMLNLKLILYMELLQNLTPGVFLTSADGIELLYSQNGQFPALGQGITALGHPSTLVIGTTHGVYCIDDGDNQARKDLQLPPDERTAVRRECKRFLHKPTIDMMKQQGAILNDEIYKQLAPIRCELEAWADFLPFGTKTHQSNGDSDVLSSDRAESVNLTQTRKKLADLLRLSGTSLQVLVLNSSKFYHIGTMDEFLDLCCANPCFRSELAISKPNWSKPNSSSNPIDHCEAVDCQFQEAPKGGAASFIHRCTFKGQANIGRRCLLVGCEFGGDVTINDNTCVYVVQVTLSRLFHVPDAYSPNGFGYAAFVLSTSDDVKKTGYLSKDLPNALCVFNTPAVSFMQNTSSVSLDKPYSIWTLPIYPVCSTREQATQSALQLMQHKPVDAISFVSMSGLIE